MTVSVVTDPRLLGHDTGRAHPERPERLQTLLDLAEGLDRGRFLIESIRRPATMEEAGWVHTTRHLEHLKAVRGRRGFMDSDTPFCERSIELAYLATGGAIQAVDNVCAGGASGAFALLRPPGHHATADDAMGFCFLNNIAIAAEHAIRAHQMRRVLIVDWDVHHGNGTQAIFDERDDVFFFSVHQWPQYPGTGSKGERGRGRGKGFTINVPLPAGSGDDVYERAFDEILAPAAMSFRPEIILVSAGFDAHAADPLGAMRVSTEGFGMLCRRVREIAAGVPLALVLEGGYDPGALRASVEACLNELALA